jgi:hypothetical protein
MTTHRIELTAASGDRATMHYRGEVIGESREPLFDAARYLLANGATIFSHACWMELEGIVSKRIARLTSAVYWHTRLWWTGCLGDKVVDLSRRRASDRSNRHPAHERSLSRGGMAGSRRHALPPHHPHPPDGTAALGPPSRRLSPLRWR